MKRNPPLVIGTVLLAFILFVAVVGPSIAPADPLAEHAGVQVNGEWIRPPYPPFTVPGFPLGSDLQGRDLLSRLLIGVRPTMILLTLAALIRLMLGAAIGMAAGWSAGWIGRLLEGVIAVGLIVPAVIVSLAVITAVGIQRGLLAFLLGLCATGWADTARIVSEQTRVLKQQPFVEAARAMGSTSTENIVRHIFRHVTPMLAMLLAFEAGATLMTIAALGFLGYYLGGAFYIEVMDFTQRAIAGLPELGQMLANSWQIFKPWATVAAGTVIFIAILGFNLVGEGLRRRLSIGSLGRRTVVSKAIGSMTAWLEEILLVSGTVGRRRRSVLGGALAVIAVVAAVLVWKPWQANTTAGGDGGMAPGLPVIGDHLWASERRDASGSAAISVAEAIPPQILWTMKEEEGFVGGPIVDGDGNVYVTGRAGVLYSLEPEGVVRWAAELPAEPAGTPALGPRTANGGLGSVYVTDQPGGVSAYTLDGGYLWRTAAANRRRASSGPIVGPDGTIYYSAVDRLQAVNPDGTRKWSSAKLPGAGDATPRLHPDGQAVFVQDAAFDVTTGRLLDYSKVVKAGLAGINAVYMVGGDGQTYLRVDHSILRWEMGSEGAVPVESTTWRWQTGTVYQPFDSGIMLDGTGILVYGSNYDDLRVVMLRMQNRLLANLHYPMRDPRLAATDATGTAYVCGTAREGAVECIGVRAGDTDDPSWRILLSSAGGQTFGGAALVPGRLYVTAREAALYAVGR